jgi:hypothetical protein
MTGMQIMTQKTTNPNLPAAPEDLPGARRDRMFRMRKCKGRLAIPVP